MSRLKQYARIKLGTWLREGMSPSRLALTLALGFSIGLLPITGVPTVLCLAIALIGRLNMPVIQAANWIAWPAQLLFALPMVKLGQWALIKTTGHELDFAHANNGWFAHALSMAGSFATHLAMGWLVALVPMTLLLTLLLRPIIKRIPVPTNEAKVA